MRNILKFTSWIQLKSKNLPKSAKDFVKEGEIDSNKNARWVYAFYKGDPLTTDYWVIVTDDGYFYDQKSKYSIFYRDSDDEICLKLVRNFDQFDDFLINYFRKG
jgi:hypothetical protein